MTDVLLTPPPTRRPVMCGCCGLPTGEFVIPGEPGRMYCEGCRDLPEQYTPDQARNGNAVEYRVNRQRLQGTPATGRDAVHRAVFHDEDEEPAHGEYNDNGLYYNADDGEWQEDQRPRCSCGCQTFTLIETVERTNTIYAEDYDEVFDRTLYLESGYDNDEPLSDRVECNDCGLTYTGPTEWM